MGQSSDETIKAEFATAEAYVERPDSVEVSINAKGMWSGSVKCYAITIEEAMKKALLKAAELEQVIREKNG